MGENRIEQAGERIATLLDSGEFSDARDELLKEFSEMAPADYRELLKVISGKERFSRGVDLRYQDENNDGLPELTFYESGRSDAIDPLTLTAHGIDQLWRSGQASRAMDELKSLFDSDYEKFRLVLSKLSELNTDGNGVGSATQDREGKVVAVTARKPNGEEQILGMYGPHGAMQVETHIAGFEREVDEKKSAGTGLDSQLVAAVQALSREHDRDLDGSLDEGELDRAMLDPSIRGEDAARVALLKKWFAELSGGDDELSKSDIEDWFKSTDARVGQLRAGMEEDHKAFAGRLGGLTADRALFSQGRASITPDAIKQGELQDCWFLSGLAALAETDPEKIEKMVRYNPERGTYTVTFPRSNSHGESQVEVPPPTDAQLALYGGGSRHGVWPAVIQAAAGRILGHNDLVPEDGLNAGGRDIGGWLVEGLKMLTEQGNEPTRIESSQRDWPERVRAALAGAFASGEKHLVVAGTRPFCGLDGMQEGHAYTVLGFDPSTGRVKLRNPYGNGEPKAAGDAARDGNDDGVFSLTLEEFLANFEQLTYAKSK